MTYINKITLLTTALFFMASCEVPPLVDSPDYVNPDAHIEITTAGHTGLDFRYEPGTTLEFNGSGSIEGDSEIANYTWDFGDGSALEEGENVSHTYSTRGSYQVIQTVTDRENETDQDTLTVVINTAPQAVIGSGDQSTYINEALIIDGSLSNDPDDYLVNYSLDMGDNTVIYGTLNSGENIPTLSHLYQSAGTYTATLTVTDSDGSTDAATFTATISNLPNVGPTADAGADQSLNYNNDGSIVTLNGSESSDSDGTITAYEWTFESLPVGSLLTNADLTNSSTPSASFNVALESSSVISQGSVTYELLLTVTDNSGESSTDSVTISMTGTGSIIIGIQ